jgi:hypothetical protein
MMFWKYHPDVITYQRIAFVDDSKQTRSALYQESFEGLAQTIHQVFTVEGDEEKPVSDFPSLPGGTLLPVFSERTLDALWHLIKGSVETAKLSWLGHRDQEIYAVFVTNVVDCLDRDKSKLAYFSSGKILDIITPVFKAEMLYQTHIFRLPDPKVSPVYLSDAFRQAVAEHNLRGLVFDKP